MNGLLDLRILGWLLVILGAIELLAVAVAVGYGEPALPYVAGSLAALLVGLPLALLVEPEDPQLRPRDAFLVVSLGWVLASVFGSIPYVATETLAPIDALFESAAGFTTTGSTVMTRIEGAPHALLLWRSVTQWLGGMGIIVFAVAVMPLLGVGGMQLMKAEMPGPSVEKVRPRVAATARRLWMIYVGFTAAEWIALQLAGMDTFDAACHALTTLATGGFSTRDASIGAFGSAAVEWIVTFFMLLAAVNFVLHHRVLTGRVRAVARDPELRFFAVVVAAAIGIAVAALLRDGWSAGPALRAAAFQVASMVSTTGYTTADFEVWPALAKLILLHLMVLGGMAGSTAGGTKTLRAVLGLRALGSVLASAGHPRAVPRPVIYRGRPVQAEALSGVWAFFAVYGLLVAAAALLIAACGYGADTAVSAALTAVGNVGPGLGEVGPFDNFAHFPAVVKLALVLCMLAGRLELFTILALLRLEFWRR